MMTPFRPPIPKSAYLRLVEHQRNIKLRAYHPDLPLVLFITFSRIAAGLSLVSIFFPPSVVRTGVAFVFMVLATLASIAHLKVPLRFLTMVRNNKSFLVWEIRLAGALTAFLGLHFLSFHGYFERFHALFPWVNFILAILFLISTGWAYRFETHPAWKTSILPVYYIVSACMMGLVLRAMYHPFAGASVDLCPSPNCSSVPASSLPESPPDNLPHCIGKLGERGREKDPPCISLVHTFSACTFDAVSPIPRIPRGGQHLDGHQLLDRNFSRKGFILPSGEAGLLPLFHCKPKRKGSVLDKRLGMKIHVEFLGLPMVSDVIGKQKLDVDVTGETVKDVIEELIRRYGKKARDAFFDAEGNFDLMIQIALNGRSFIPADRHNTPLKDGDNLIFMLLLAGG